MKCEQGTSAGVMEKVDRLQGVITLMGHSPAENIKGLSPVVFSSNAPCKSMFEKSQSCRYLLGT